MIDRDEFPSNSIGGVKMKRRPLDLRPPRDEKKIVKVTTGKVIQRKKPFIDRFAETFWGGDAGSIGEYILYDVLLPAAKDTIFDMILTGAKMLLFGKADRSIPGRRNDRDKTYVSYGSFYKGGRFERAEPVRGRANMSNFDQVVMASRGEADDVLTTLIEAIDNYDVATVADFYQAVGIAPSSTDNNYGWTHLGSAGVEPTRDGYIINLPRPRPID
jgi:hypothetical protein